MPSRPVSIRFNVDDKEEWKAHARTQGMSFNKWVVLACRGQFELERAEAREKADVIAEREALQKAAFPDQGEKCGHVQKGQFCYQCSATRW